MKNLVRVAAFAACTALAAPVPAQSVVDGMDAYRAGDYATALEILRPLAENGDAGAQSSLGLMYFHGRGVPQDYAEAMLWYSLAAEQGDALAQRRLNRLVALLQEGDIEAEPDFFIGVIAYDAGDYAAALENWRPLAEQGHARAQTALGVVYQNGDGVPQDSIEAARWYRLAAEQGDAHAQNNLAVMYQNGDGVPQDGVEAARWYRLAAEQGDARAQANLGAMYANGQGVPRDYVLAHMWSNIASTNGEDHAAENRIVLEGDMTRDQIADAQARARVCMASDYQDCD